MTSSGDSARPDESTDPQGEELPEVTSLAELARLAGERPGLFVRWSRGPEADADERSCDHASGLELPGLAVNPLTPPRWWTRPVEDWLARQVRAYAHLGEEEPEHHAWVLTGQVVDRGPDNEPLVNRTRPVARLAPALLSEAARREPQSPRDQDQDTHWRS